MTVCLEYVGVVVDRAGAHYHPSIGRSTPRTPGEIPTVTGHRPPFVNKHHLIIPECREQSSVDKARGTVQKLTKHSVVLVNDLTTQPFLYPPFSLFRSSQTSTYYTADCVDCSQNC